MGMLKRLALVWLLLMWPAFQWMPSRPLAAPLPQALFFGQIPSALSSAVPQLVVSHAYSLGVSGGTTPTLNTSGSNFLIVAVCQYQSAANGLTSSPANTWNSLTSYAYSGGAYAITRLYYAANATTSSTQTFTPSGGGYMSAAVSGYSGVAATLFDVQDGKGNSSLTTSVQATSGVLPNYSGELVVSALGTTSSGTYSIDSSFSIDSQVAFVSSTSEGCGIAHLVQTTAVSVNPTWSWTSNFAAVTALASFKHQ
jgi:hypothetical protein